MIIQDAILHARNNNKPYLRRKSWREDYGHVSIKNQNNTLLWTCIKDVLADDWECYTEDEIG